MIPKIKIKLMKINGKKCMICGERPSSPIEHHHLIPRSAGGKNDYENGSLLCARCHSIVHKYEYGSCQYELLTKLIKTNKKMERT